MPARVQSYLLGLAIGKQTDISTLQGSPTWMRMRKLDQEIYTTVLETEDDAGEIGKGTEFATQTFPTANTFAGSIQKFASAEFTTWAWAGALGNVAYATSTYTLTPINPSTTIELPYFAMVTQLNEGGSSAIDELHLGNMIAGVTTTFNSGVGRGTGTNSVQFRGSGKTTSPSSITLPSTVQSESYMISSAMTAMTVLSTDYVANKRIVRGSMSWNNTPLINAGYFPGSGSQNGGALMGRIETGARVPGFSFEVRLANNSPEYAALLAQTSGTATVTMYYDATHYVTWVWQKLIYKNVVRSVSDGLATIAVTGTPAEDATNGVLTVTAKCGVTGIFQ